MVIVFSHWFLVWVWCVIQQWTTDKVSDLILPASASSSVKWAWCSRPCLISLSGRVKERKPVSLEALSLVRCWRHRHQGVTTGVSGSGQGLWGKRHVVSPSEGLMHTIAPHNYLAQNVSQGEVEKLWVRGKTLVTTMASAWVCRGQLGGINGWLTGHSRPCLEGAVAAGIQLSVATGDLWHHVLRWPVLPVLKQEIPVWMWKYSSF